MTVTTDMIKELRDATGVGILDCRKALVEADGDYDKDNHHADDTGHFQAASMV